MTTSATFVTRCWPADEREGQTGAGESGTPEAIAVELVIAAVGRPRTSGVREAIQEYERRASRYFRLRVIEISSADLPDSAADRARTIEGQMLLKRIPERLQLCALTRTGQTMSSREFAVYLEEMATYSLPGVAFLLGGAHGLSPTVFDRAQRHLSLSTMTLPHEMARLMLAEQLYRAGTIHRAEPYHKGA